MLNWTEVWKTWGLAPMQLPASNVCQIKLSSFVLSYLGTNVFELKIALTAENFITVILQTDLKIHQLWKGHKFKINTNQSRRRI